MLSKTIFALFLLNSIVSLIESVANPCDMTCGQNDPGGPRYVKLNKGIGDAENCANYHQLMTCIEMKCEADSMTSSMLKRYDELKECPEPALCARCDGFPLNVNVSRLNKYGCEQVLKKFECLKKNKCNTSMVPKAKKEELEKCINQPDIPPPADPCSSCGGMNLNWEQYNVTDSRFIPSVCEVLLINVKCRRENKCNNAVTNDTEEALEKCSKNPPMPADPCDGPTGKCKLGMSANWPIFFEHNNISSFGSYFCKSTKESLECRKEHKCPTTFPDNKLAELEECIKMVPQNNATTENPSNTTNRPMTPANGFLFLFFANVWIALLIKFL